MKILVTGANGFVGQALCAQLAANGYELARAVRVTESAQLSVGGGLSAEFAVGDIGADTDWRAALEGCDAVVHLAARVHVMRDTAHDPLVEFRKVNTAGTLKLARQAATAGVRRFVYLSSIKVNGEYTLAQPFTETDKPAPHDAYAISKWEAEEGLLALARETGLDVVVIRPPLVYGPGVKGNFAALVKWARRGIPLPLGALNNWRSLVALENLLDFIMLCADREKSASASHQVFLIADGEDVSTTDLLRRAACAFGAKSRLIPLPASWMRFAAGLLGKTEVADRLLGSLRIDNSRAREMLGWRPVVSMDEALRKMADAARS
ncbi:MAG: SDR family oxidoreductase [Zoogloeaceae bacterium]|nr:SDR family oxidoreductase [Zoogloeaceae bacterium]